MRTKQTARKNNHPLQTKLALAARMAAVKEIVIPDAFYNVPNPILLEIFSYLDFKKLMSIRRVCSKWKKFIDSDKQSLFERLFILHYPQYVSKKTDTQSWKTFYIQTVFSLLSESVNNVENDRHFFCGTLISLA